MLPTNTIKGDGWRHWSDGQVEQLYRIPPAADANIYIERVVTPSSRRKRWVVVDRRGVTRKAMHSNYPPKIAGPFPDLDSAKAAYLMVIAALT